jgi:HAD superfamily hydrolase (TIGR01549 family)
MTDPRFDAVFFDSGGTLLRDPEDGLDPSIPGMDEVRTNRFRRTALCMQGMGYKTEEDSVTSLLPELEKQGPEKHGASYTYTDLMIDLGIAMHIILQPEEAAAAADAYVGPRYRAWLFPGVPETLKTLYEHNIYIGLISNTYIPAYTVDRSLYGYGIKKYFRILVCSGDVGLIKPDIAIFKLALERSGLYGKRILYVGDKVEKDIKPPKSIGWKAALRLFREKTSNGSADFEFSETEELLEFIME